MFKIICEKTECLTADAAADEQLAFVFGLRLSYGVNVIDTDTLRLFQSVKTPLVHGLHQILAKVIVPSALSLGSFVRRA